MEPKSNGKSNWDKNENLKVKETDLASQVEKMKGKEIEKKYKIMVLLPSGVGMNDEISLICSCGHHAKDHKEVGTAGYCVKCGRVYGACHNFNPIG